MRNKLTVLIALSLVLFVAMGCSLGGITGSDEDVTKDATSKSSDSKSGDSSSEPKKEAEPSGEVIKVGIPECDEVATYINDNSEAIDDSYAAKAIVYLYKNYALETIKENVETMSDEDKAKMARSCKKTMEDLKKNL